MKNYLTLSVILFLSNSYAQDKRTISGTITEEKSGEKIVGAILFDTISKKGVGTNEYGFYSLTIPNENAVLRVSFYGMETQFVYLPIGSNTLNVALAEKTTTTSEVVIVGNQNREIESSNSGSIQIQMDKVEKLKELLSNVEANNFNIYLYVPSIPENVYSMAVKCFITLAPESNVIKVFTTVSYNFL
jgi:hypothetical protein